MPENIPALPAGFTLDQTDDSIPALPAGFTIDQPVEQLDPRIALQDLIIEQSKAPTPERQEQITALRVELGIPDESVDASQFKPVQAEQPAGTGPLAAASNIAIAQATGVPDVATGAESFARGTKQGLLNVGTGVLSFAGKIRDKFGDDTALQFLDELEISRNIEQQKTEQITESSPIAGFAGELAGETAALPFPAAKTVKGAAALGGITGALTEEGQDRDPVTGLLVGATLGGTLKKVENIVGGFIGRKSLDRAKATDALSQQEPDVRALGYQILEGEEKARRNPKLLNLINDAESQGFDRGTLAIVSQTNNATKKKLLHMVNIAKEGIYKPIVKKKTRPSDVLGKSLLKRLNTLGRGAKKHGNDIDRAAESLKELRIDPINIETQFADTLAKSDIKISNGKLDFAGSTIEGADAAQKTLTDIFKRFQSVDRTKPHQLHKLKRYIDNNVEYGNTPDKPLLREVDGIIKSLRQSVDDSLDNLSPSYDKANSSYSEIVRAIDPFRKITGKKINSLSDAGQSKAIGTILRRELSNATSRAPIEESREIIDATARKFGGKFDDNLEHQIAVVDAIEGMGLAEASTSLKGQIPVSKMDAQGKVIEKVLSKILPEKSDIKAVNALEKLIKGSRQ